MSKKALDCQICFHAYSKERIPKNLPFCGHTICLVCLDAILKSNPKDPKCPFDKGILPTAIDKFPTSFALLEIIEERQSKGICEEHQEELINFCWTDNCKICNDCGVSGAHKGHDVQTFKQARLEANTKITELDKVLEVFGKGYEDLKDNILKKNMNERNFVQEIFSQIKDLIIEKEKVILAELSFCYEEKRNYLEKTLGSCSAFSLSTKDKISAFKSEIEKKNFHNVKGVNLEKFIPEIESFISSCQNTIESNEKEVYDVLSNQLNKIRDDINQTSFSMYSDDWKGFREFKIPTTFPLIPEVLDSQKNQLQIKSSFSLEKVNDCLKVEQKKEDIVTLNREMLENIKSIWISFNEKSITQEDSAVLRDSFENIPENETYKLNVKFCQLSLDNEGLVHSFPIIFSQIQQIQGINLDFNNNFCLENHSQSFRVLCKYLSKIPKLNYLRMNLNYTKILSQSLNQLTTCLQNLGDLTTFYIFLTGLGLTDEDVLQFLRSLPNLKSLQLGLGDNKITDKTIQALGSKLQDMGKLDELWLSFYNNNITSQSILEVFKNIQNVSKFCLYLENINIDDQAIIEIGKIVSSMKNLKQAKISINKGITEIGRDILNSIHTKFPYPEN